MTDKTPLEILMVDALEAKRLVDEHEAKAKSADPQWRLYHQKEAANNRAVLDYLLGRAWEHAALFLED